ncbi:MAG: SOS response-associated peptidase [Opitutales bacterium]
MCGRFTLHISPRVLSEHFLLEKVPPIEARYNIAPTQGILSIREDRDKGRRTAVPVTWGLVPSWARDVGIGNKLINARAETAREKPAFRSAYRHRRCLIPASGFYEWRKEPTGRQPFWIHPKAADRPLAMAGLWEHWSSPDGSEIESATILTTEANGFMAGIHHRMPVFLQPADYATWLEPETRLDVETYARLTAPAPENLLTAHPVARSVGSPRNDDPSLIEPVDTDVPPLRKADLKGESRWQGPRQQELF